MIQALTKRTFEEYDEDRQRLSRELHNSALQDLAALELNLSSIPGADLPPRARKALKDCSALALSCARAIRATCDRLYPTLLDQVGLAAAIRAFAAEAGIKLMPDIPEDFGPLPEAIAIGAFRVIEELAGNCETPGRITLNVIRESSSLAVSVAGTGEIRQSVRDRVAALGGKLALFQAGGHRTVSVQLPLTTEES